MLRKDVYPKYGFNFDVDLNVEMDEEDWSLVKEEILDEVKEYCPEHPDCHEEITDCLLFFAQKGQFLGTQEYIEENYETAWKEMAAEEAEYEHMVAVESYRW